MFNILNSVYFYLYYDYVKNYFYLVPNGNDKEEIYYEKTKTKFKNRLFLVIKDNEIGKRLYDVLKNIKDNDSVISSQNSYFKLKNFGYDKENVVKYIYFEFYMIYDWNILSEYEKLNLIVSIIENLRKIGLYFDGSRFKNFKFDCISEFLSYFIKVSDGSEIPNNYIVEYIHNILSQGGNLNEFYKNLTEQKILCKKEDFPYSLGIARLCYQYYKNGDCPLNISEILEESRYSLLEEKEYKEALIAIDEDLKSKYNLTEDNDKFSVYDGRIKIYHKMSSLYKESLIDRRFILDCNKKVIEQIDELIINLDGKIIGYTFSSQNLKNAHKLLDKEFNTQKEIIDLIEEISQIPFDEKYQDLTCKDDFDIENSLVYLGDSSTNNHYEFKIRSIEDLFNFIFNNKEDLEKQITKFFFKLLLKFINRNGELKREKQFLEKIEIKYLNPTLAREFIKFALGKIVNYKDAARELFNFLKNKKESENNIYYDYRFDMIPGKEPFLFEFEVKNKYNLNKGSSIILSDNRRLVLLSRSKKIKKLNNNLQQRYSELYDKLALSHDDGNIKCLGISQIIYSKDLNSEGMYNVCGYITNQIIGEPLTMEYLLKLNNKELLKLFGKFFGKFKYSHYYIPWECVRVDKEYMFQIDILNDNFHIMYYGKDVDNYLEEISKDLVNHGYNPNAFIDFDFDADEDELLRLSEKMDAYCDEHKIYYDSKKGQCNVCAQTKFLIDKNFNMNKVVFEDSMAKHYQINEEYMLKVYKKTIANLSKIEENITRIVIGQLSSQFFSSQFQFEQDLFIPYKKAFDKNKKFIGYVYKSVKFNNDTDKKDVCIDIKDLTKMSNLPRLKTLIRLLIQIEDLTNKGFGFLDNPFTHVFLNPSHKRQVQILNIDLLGEVNIEKTKEWACKYVCDILDSDSSIEIDTSKYINDFQGILFELQDMANHMKGHCTIHNIYYMDKYVFCPKCVNDSKLLENFEVEKHSKQQYEGMKSENEGGEAYIYPYNNGQKEVVKIFKDNQENEMNYNLKSMTIIRIMSKRNILKDINSKGYKFKYIYPQKLIVDSDTNKMIGYTMARVKDGQIISNLRDKDIIQKLGFTFKDVLEILITIGEGIETLHSRANIFIGDLNGGNILFDKKKNVYFLDFDGMGVDEIQPEFCTDGYIDPVSKKNQNITAKDDWYSFAIQAFYYLTYTHPFNGIYYKEKEIAMDITERMEKKISLLGNHGIEIPSIALSWEWMTDELKNAFLEIFEGNSRESIVPYLKNQYKNLKTSFSNELQPLSNIVRISSKFIATEIESYITGNIVKFINSYSAICEDSYGNNFVAVLINKHQTNNNFLQNYYDINYYNIKDIVLSDDKNYFFIIFSNMVFVFNSITNKFQTVKINESSSTVINNNTIYYTEVRNDKFCIVKNTVLNNMDIKEDVIEIENHYFKWFNVMFNTKFILVERTNDGIDRVYCNSEKFCDIKYSSIDSEYNIIYDNATKCWIVINSDGNGIVIQSNGEYTSLDISQYVSSNTYDISNIQFVDGKIYIPIYDYLYIVKVNDHTVKKMECHKIMTPESKLFDINALGFSVVNEKVLYEVRRG